MVVSLIRVLESGLPPLGGSAAPPKTLVSRRMKVLLPQPESAAKPMTTVLTSAEHEIKVLAFLVMVLWVVVKTTTFFWLDDKWVFVGVEIEHVGFRDFTVYTVQTAIFVLSLSLSLEEISECFERG